MQLVAVIVGLVVHDFFKIGNGFCPFFVEEVDFATKCIRRSLGGTAVISGFPADWQLGDGVSRVVDDRLPDVLRGLVTVANSSSIMQVSS